MARLTLVRHGQSEWNAAGRWQGQADPPLSQLGVRQAEAAAAAINGIELVGTSTLERSYTTAAIIAERVGLDPPVGLPDLVERAAGDWTGMTKVEIEERWPGAIAEWRIPQNMETNEQLWERVRPALVDFADVVGERRALVVTHGGVISNIRVQLGEPWERCPNLSGVVVEVDNGAIDVRERVSLLDGSDVEATVPNQL